MANQLGMDKVQAIKSLHAAGMSERRIASTLGVSRKAVRRHLGRSAAKDTKAPTGPAPIGSSDSKDTNAPTGSAAASPAAKGPSRSLCLAHRDSIIEKLEQGLTAQRIYQDLCEEHGFTGKYSSVRRFVRQLSERSEIPFRRIEVEPGYEMQVDYGAGARCKDHEGKVRMTHLFRLVLSYSRNGKERISSDGPKGNCGYPLRADEIEHFMTMLNSTAINASPEQLDKIKRALDEYRKRREKDRGN